MKSLLDNFYEIPERTFFTVFLKYFNNEFEIIFNFNHIFSSQYYQKFWTLNKYIWINWNCGFRNENARNIVTIVKTCVMSFLQKLMKNWSKRWTMWKAFVFNEAIVFEREIYWRDEQLKMNFFLMMTYFQK